MRRGDNKPKVVSILPIAMFFMGLPILPTLYCYDGSGIEPQSRLTEGRILSRIGNTSIPFLA